MTKQNDFLMKVAIDTNEGQVKAKLSNGRVDFYISDISSFFKNFPIFLTT